MTIDLAMLALLISLILAVLAGGVFIGRLSEKVRSNRLEIDANKEEAKAYRLENREEHKTIAVKLDRIIMNGGSKA